MWEADFHLALGQMAPGGFWQDDIYFAPCPLHDDQDYSLQYVRSTRTWWCESGCGDGDLVALGVRLWQCGIEEAAAKILDLCGDGCRQVVSRYPYLDARGQFLFEVLRFKPKGFDTRIPTQWKWHDIARCRPGEEQLGLYRLPEVLTAYDVLIVEGEKDCETARAMGLVATCNVGGSSRWNAEYVAYFRGKRVQIVADADMSGRRHVREIAGSLLPVAESVKLIEFSDVKDLTEWVEAGGTLEELMCMFSNTPALSPSEVEGWWDPLRTIRLQCEADFLLESHTLIEPTSLDADQSLEVGDHAG
jgi:hypothetical protein